MNEPERIWNLVVEGGMNKKFKGILRENNKILQDALFLDCI